MENNNNQQTLLLIIKCQLFPFLMKWSVKEPNNKRSKVKYGKGRQYSSSEIYLWIQFKNENCSCLMWSPAYFRQTMNRNQPSPFERTIPCLGLGVFLVRWSRVTFSINNPRRLIVPSTAMRWALMNISATMPDIKIYMGLYFQILWSSEIKALKCMWGHLKNSARLTVRKRSMDLVAASR